MSLRVAVSTGSLRPDGGGGWRLTSLLVDALAGLSTKHEYIIVDAAAEEERVLAQDGARRAKKKIVDFAKRIVPTSVRSGINYFRAANRDQLPLRTLIKASRPDVVWFMHQPGFPLTIPYIATVYDLEHRTYPFVPEVHSRFEWMPRDDAFRAVLPRAARVITGTEVGKDEVTRFYGVDPRNVRVVPFPAPPIRADEVQSSNDDALLQKLGIPGSFIFYPGHFWPHKNHANLVRALSILHREKGIRLNLVFTGSDKGNRGYVHQVIDELGLSNHVFDLGFVSRDEIRALFKGAVALTYPSMFGPDNLPPLEAFAWGCPVVASDTPGTREQLRDAALLCKPNDPACFAASIAKIVNDDSCRRSLIAAGSKVAAERTPLAYVTQVDRMLDEFEPFRRAWGAEYETLPWGPERSSRWKLESQS